MKPLNFFCKSVRNSSNSDKYKKLNYLFSKLLFLVILRNWLTFQASIRNFPISRKLVLLGWCEKYFHLKSWVSSGKLGFLGQSKKIPPPPKKKIKKVFSFL